MNLAMKYFYATKLGKPTRKVIVHPLVSAAIGAYMDTSMSTRHIEKFVRKNKIDLDEYVSEEYSCFNDFFTRQIKPDSRSIDYTPEVLISPCDGQMTAFRISSDSEFYIKESYYNVEDLVGGDKVAKEYINGTCLVLRLAVDNYHRYCYIDDGFKSRNYHIQGRYNPVQPIVVHRHPVFRQNTREYCILHTKNFGDVIQIEVGACLVGKIKNHSEACVTHRGEEKGMFLFGGSTIVLLFKENTVKIPESVFNLSVHGMETPIKFGQAIGNKYE